MDYGLEVFLMPEEINEKVAKLEVTVNEHSKQLEKQQEKNDTQVETNTLVKMYIESVNALKEQMEKFADTIVKVNKNLDNLNNNQSVLDERVSGIESTLKESSIDTMSVFKGVLKYVATAVGSIILAYILFKFGLN